MSTLSDIGTYLSSQGVGTLGTDLFLGLMPESPDNATCVYETGGPGAIHAMSASAGQARVVRPHIQVVMRGGTDSYEAARALAQKAWLLLDGLPTRTINVTSYFWGEAIQSEPFLIGRDEQNRPLIGCNYRIEKQVSTTS